MSGAAALACIPFGIVWALTFCAACAALHIYRAYNRSRGQAAGARAGVARFPKENRRP